MRKHYEAPVIVFEDFSLSTNIAATCGTVVNFGKSDCWYETRTGLHVFMSGMNGCTTAEDDGEYNGICYHVPVEEQSLFSS